MTEKELVELKINAIYQELYRNFEIEPVSDNQMKVFKDPTKTFIVITVRSYVDISIAFHKDNGITDEGNFRSSEDILRKAIELLDS